MITRVFQMMEKINVYSPKSTSGRGDGVSGTKVVGDCINVALHMGHVRFLLYINQDRIHAL